MMETNDKITLSATVNADMDTIWQAWTEPKHIVKWNSASPDWHTPKAENDLRAGGKFCSRMEAKDGSMGFDMGGTYNEVVHNKLIKYTLDDGRKVSIVFEEVADGMLITETFEPEQQNSADRQRQGWQAILEHFKRYVEN